MLLANTRYKWIQSLIQNHMQHERSESAREQRTALYKNDVYNHFAGECIILSPLFFQGSLTILKIDIESYEWDVVDDILSTEGLFASIPQVLIEWHLFAEAPPRSRYDELVSIYFRFKDSGFRKFHWQSEGRDHFIGRLRSQAETSWVNRRFIGQTKKIS